MRMTRREALKLGLLGGGSLLLPLTINGRTQAHDGMIVSDSWDGSPFVKPFSLPFKVPPVLQPVRRDSSTKTEYYEITMRPNQVEILPGLKTKIWGYNGIAPGPTIRTEVGWKTVVRQINQLPTPTCVHLHGMPSLPQFDGYANDLTPPNYYKDYLYPNTRAATLWYHDHAVHRTAMNINMGLAGFYILQDEFEKSLPLPSGKYDVPLLVQDKMFAKDGSIVYDDEGQKSLYGDTILVNGTPWPVMKVENRKYRFRILNASLSRSYRLALSTGAPFHVIGTDAGLMPTVQSVTSMRLGKAERYEFIIDFSGYQPGTQVVLRNLSLPNNEDFAFTDRIMRFDVVKGSADNLPIPTTLRPVQPVLALQPSQAVRTRDFRLERKNGLWTINGKTWDPNRIDANPRFGDIEIWRFYNSSGGWHHPMHIHLVDFKILDRNGKPPFAYERGPKDVVFVGEGESVRVIMKFEPNQGKYMMHCHNMVHEDHDMMVQFQVGQGGPDPVTAAPAKPLPAPPL